jgi:hypothetical protein
MRKKWIFIVPAAIIGILLFMALGGEVVKLLWNWLLPPLFGWHAINFWQALGILALCRILFGRMGGRGFRGKRFRGRMGERERCGNMTPEERERIRSGIREHWGFGHSTGESKAE